MNETNGFLPLNDALQYPEVRGDVPFEIKEGVIEDIAYVLNKTKHLSIIIPEKDRFLPLYKSICNIVKCREYLEKEDYVIFQMGRTPCVSSRLLYNKETKSKEARKQVKTKILESIKV